MLDLSGPPADVSGAFLEDGPFAEFEDLYQRMSQLLDGAFDGWQPTIQAWAPHADLSETDQAYVAEIELPGVARDDTSGEFRDSSSGTHGRALRRGRRSGQFEYRVLLPGHAEADQVTAALADGVLAVTVPNTETDKPHRIPVIS
jgi:HSP20 family protein